MHHRSRPRRREAPPAAAEFGRRRVSVNPAPNEDHYDFRKRSNATSTAIDSGYIMGFSAEEDTFAAMIKRSPSKKTSEVLIKDLIEEELSKGKVTKHSSPSLIAKLMDLDAFPSLVKQKKNMDSPIFWGNYVKTEDHSKWRNKERQELKHVLQISKPTKSKKHSSHSDMRAKHRQRAYEDYEKNKRGKFMDINRQSPIELFYKSKELNGAFGISDSSRDLFLELLQDSNSLFAKHLQDLKHAQLSHQSKITILKPSKCRTENGRNKVGYRSSRTEKSNNRFTYMHQEITGSCKTHEARPKKCLFEEDTGSLPYNPLAPQRGRSKPAVHPAHIVILKPILEKAQKVPDANFLDHDNLWFDSKKDKKIAASRAQEFCDKEETGHMVNDAEENYRRITRKMRHSRSRLSKLDFSPPVAEYTGDGDSLTMLDITKLPDSADPCGNWRTRLSPLSMASTKYCVSMEDPNHHYLERGNVTQLFQNLGLISRCSSTHGEVLELSEEETPRFSVDFLHRENISLEALSRDEILGSWSFQLGISREDSPRYGSSIFSPRSNSLPASCSPKYKDRKSVGSSTTELPTAKQSEHPNYNYQLAGYVAEENMASEREIHVNSEGLRKRIHAKDLVTKTNLNTAITNHAITNSKRYHLNDSTFISIPGDEVWHLTTQEEHAMKSAFHVPLDNGYGYVKDIILQKKPSGHPHGKSLPSDSNVAKSQPLSSNDLEQPSPVSVLETPLEDETYSSELRIQLQRLKMDSGATCAEESQVLVLSDEDCAAGDCELLPLGDLHEVRFKDVDDRDFTYLVDILLETGIQSVHDDKLIKECCCLGFAFDQYVFDKLEKSYDGISSWSRSERKLLFDVVSCNLVGLVTSSYSDVCLGMPTSKLCLPTYNSESLVDALWQIVVKQRKEIQCSQEKMILEPGWLGWKIDANVVGIEMERLLNADLLEELVSELLL
ncbi:hypothetical protein ZIOFF_075860 [Zingiber officinale]|uniref:DUF4378 domain-containing protein n=1 Tax=Zingiber officinale TaxID=94328 RepID=A0A8J5C0Q8_ZINOF|nr:hypothetical protein ZIOFF_075860 [Zingiber officinale]